MQKSKRIVVSLLLLAVTAAIVVLPRYFGSEQKRLLADNSISWSYIRHHGVTVTPTMVAQLYYNREIDWYMLQLQPSSLDTDYRLSAKTVLADVFSDHQAMLSAVSSLLDSGNISYSEGSILTVIDGYPIALHCIEVIASSDSFSIQLLFEEKSKCCLWASLFTSTSFDKERLISTLEHYYEEKLGVTNDAYYIQMEYPAGEKDICCLVNFGIQQIFYKEDICYETDTD